MGIQSATEYVNFYINLNMGDGTNLLRFVNDEKRIIKLKLENKNNKKELLRKGIEILEGLVKEINEIGEKEVLIKYQKTTE
jgi:hypothetical protein